MKKKIKRLRIDKYVVNWNGLNILVNPFMRGEGNNFFKLMWLNFRLVFYFLRRNIRSLYRYVFNIKPKPQKSLTKEEKLELAREINETLKGFLEVSKKLNKITEHNKLRKKWGIKKRGE